MRKAADSTLDTEMTYKQVLAIREDYQKTWSLKKTAANFGISVLRVQLSVSGDFVEGLPKIIRKSDIMPAGQMPNDGEKPKPKKRRKKKMTIEQINAEAKATGTSYGKVVQYHESQA